MKNGGSFHSKLLVYQRGNQRRSSLGDLAQDHGAIPSFNDFNVNEVDGLYPNKNCMILRGVIFADRSQPKMSDKVG